MDRRWMHRGCMQNQVRGSLASIDWLELSQRILLWSTPLTLMLRHNRGLGRLGLVFCGRSNGNRHQEHCRIRSVNERFFIFINNLTFNSRLVYTRVKICFVNLHEYLVGRKIFAKRKQKNVQTAFTQLFARQNLHQLVYVLP